MVDKIQTLLVSLEARMTQYEREMKKASTTANKRMNEIDARVARTSKLLRGMGAGAFAGLAKGALTALAPILSVTAALNTARAAMSDFDRIAKNAKAAGFDGEAFQEFAYSAELGGVATDDFAKALETFNKNAGLAAEGKGKMVAQLKALNPELLRSILATTDQATRFKLAADAIDKAATASEKAALASVLFGDAGTRMVEVLRGGSAALEETARKARSLGLVISNELLARAETLNDEFETATRIMDLQFKQALIELAPVLIATAQLAGAVARGINGIVDSMKALEARSSAGLEDRLAFLQKGGLGNGPGNRSEGADNAAAAAEIAQIEAILRRRAIESLREQLTKPKIVVDGAGIELPDLGGGGSRNTAVDALLKQAEAVRDIVANLEHERAQLGRTSQEQELYNLLKQAGVERESEFGQAIESALGPLQAQRVAIERNAAAMEEMRDAARSALETITNGFIEGKDAGEIFNDVLRNISSNLLNMGFNRLFGGGSTPGSGLFGQMFGFAAGGYTGNGAKNDPAGVVHKGEYVFSKSRTQQLGVANLERLHRGYANGGFVGMPGPVLARAANDNVPSLTFAPVIDARGADVAAVARLEQVLAKQAAEFDGRVKQVVRGKGTKWR